MINRRKKQRKDRSIIAAIVKYAIKPRTVNLIMGLSIANAKATILTNSMPIMSTITPTAAY